jgi:sugar/nucleoside kinase (ribokinase family)
LPYIDVCSTNKVEGELLTGEVDPAQIGRKLVALGTETVVVKQAEKGCTVVTKESHIDVPGFVVDVVDTTCAGDCFVAGYLFGISKGLSKDDAARLGNAAGALCTTAISHQGIKSLEYTLAFARSQGVCIPLA